MEQRLCVSKEYGRIGSDGNRDLSKITHQELKTDDSIVPLADLIAEYGQKVLGIDLDYTLDLSGLTFHGIEIFVAKKRKDGCRFHICYDDGKPIGLLLFQVAAELLWIRGFYIKPEYEGSKIARSFFRSCPEFRTKILYQIQKDLPPFRLLNHISKDSIKLTETKEHETLIVEWKDNK